MTEVVELGPEFLREYLRFNKGGDGRVELEPFIALVESTLLRRGLRVFRKQVRVRVRVRVGVRVRIRVGGRVRIRVKVEVRVGVS